MVEEPCPKPKVNSIRIYQGMKQLCLCLMACFFLACEKNEANDMPVVKPPSDTLRYLALGDSYTKGQSVPAASSFPIQLRDSLIERGKVVKETSIIAETGWTTSNLKSAIAAAFLPNDYEMVSLLIGVNNFYQNKDTNLYIQEFEELLNSAIGFADGKSENVFVVSIPDYGFSPFGQGSDPQKIAEQTDQYNRVASSICAKYSVQFIDITPISRSNDPSLIASDGLHPSAKQYSLWVERILGQRVF